MMARAIGCSAGERGDSSCISMVASEAITPDATVSGFLFAGVFLHAAQLLVLKKRKKHTEYRLKSNMMAEDELGAATGHGYP